ncbi:MAG: hypothetical protein HY876_03980 [Coriobacteriales bacterium]|nr:hypothetical protein [Coriobacteriales bacterium]
MNRRILIVTVLVFLVLLGLGGFYLYLTGGQADATSLASEAEASPAETGIVPVKSIYAANGTNLFRPTGVGADSEGDFYVTLKDSQKVVAFTRSGKTKAVWGKRGAKSGELMAPLGVSADRGSDQVYVTDRSRLRLIAFSSDGRFLWETPLLNPLTPLAADEGVIVTTFGPIALLDDSGQFVRQVGSRGPVAGQFDFARGVAQVAEGDYVIADTNNARVQRVSFAGEETATVRWVDGTVPKKQDDPKTRYGVPSGVAVDDAGRAYVLDGFRHTISVLDVESGKRIHVFKDLEGKSDGHFYLPTGIAYLGGDTFAITDTFNDRVQIVRLLLPGRNNLFMRNPNLLWLLLLLLLLPLAALFFRRSTYASHETLEKAMAAGQLTLLAAVYKRIRVLPETHERFKDVVERDVRFGDYLIRLDHAEGDASAEQRLADASRVPAVKRLLFPRVAVIAVDDAQAERLEELRSARTVTLVEVAQTYALDDAKGAESPTG